MINICCITYKNLNDLVKPAIELIDQSKMNVSIISGLQNEVISPLQKQVINGVDIVLAGGSNASIVKRNFEIPVKDYKISEVDYINAINRATHLGDKVGIFFYQINLPFKLITYIKEEKPNVTLIEYKTAEDIEDAIKEYDLDVVIGSSLSCEIASKNNVAPVLIYPSVQSIADTINEAYEMASEIKRVEEASEFSRTILEYTSNAVFLLDENFTIIGSNPAVNKIFNTSGKNYKNKQINEVIPDWKQDQFLQSSEKENNMVREIRGQQYLEKTIKIGDNDNSFNGAVLIYSMLGSLNKAELEYEIKKREDERQRGFVTKNSLSDIIGSSFKTKSVIKDAEFYAKSDANVLVYGETGVGKELFVQGIHKASKRAKAPFVAVNCGALTESLLESELFGYDEGAFTGGREGGRKGLFELAEDGTIFLDEIGEISPAMQTKLLRVIQEQEIMRVGGDRIIPINVRVISATNKELDSLDHETFRRDLLYRLNVLELKVPPLRDRGEDAYELFNYFFQEFVNIKFQKITLPRRIKKAILLYDWPGNIRELQNVSERFSLFIEHSSGLNDDQIYRLMIKAIGEDKLVRRTLNLYNYENKGITKELIELIEKTFDYTREEIAQTLNISRTTLWRITKSK